MASMDGNYKVFVKNSEFEQTKEVQKQFDENEIDFPSKLNVTVSNSDPSRSLRTSKKITSYLLRNLKNENADQIKTFQELSQRINQSILENIKNAGCFRDVSVEGEFQNQINKYQYDQLDLKFRFTEDPIFSCDYGVSIDQKQRNFGIVLMPQFTNMLGQCESIVFRMRKSYFDFNKELKLFSSFTFPYFSPESCIQEYEFGMADRQVLNDLRTKMFKFRGNFYLKKDPRFKLAVSTTSHHYSPDITATNVLAHNGSIFDQTMQTYQNLVFKATFTDKTQIQQEFNTQQMTQVSAKLGIGSNMSLFAKARYLNMKQKLHQIQIGETKIPAMAQNQFQAGCVFSKNNLHFSENFTLTNQPSYKNIDLQDKNINSTNFGSRYFLTNQFKYYFLKFPFLQKVDILPFLHLYTAFVPTNLNLNQENKLSSLIKQNVRLSAGIGLTYEINEFDKIDFIYSFADFIPQDKKDNFCKFQLNFY
ncbi:hypothetical protein TTHERM_00196240 (macronuclear) [Tetrahymena thermophila SB210]|uniref:Uncharacterized protein n=1 Tax=Tetrahymena thermophila (strain SB210) TaxID=312017 RepID=Q23K10_TETTS|nr:hypothetical protein TTHERM_00196240 [Tetrahymena thermophila SB210]EAR97033.1 hypothetical protein TTHERM_00196240 [Tetrahymena thermophila SB210]|eukprot:XP_001017278.1 hypothetical protein TTHERM_00196240 [Tetrahymena thermophila SB210]